MQSKRASNWALGFILVSGLACSLPAGADGRIEINQASVEAAGGFPFTITEPGSYVLTGPLTVPAETSGLVIATSNVTIDLNIGWTIALTLVTASANAGTTPVESVIYSPSTSPSSCPAPSSQGHSTWPVACPAATT